MITADGDRLRDAFCRPLQLSGDLMEQRDIDLELLEFLTAPVSVQGMDVTYQEEKWAEAWTRVSEENQWWMGTQKHELTKQEWPYCRLCGDWAPPAHLCPAACRRKVGEHIALHGHRKGPLVDAILTTLNKE